MAKARHGKRAPATMKDLKGKIALDVDLDLSRERRRRVRVDPVRLIAAFKLAKGVLLFILGVATINFRHHDVTDVLGTWVDQLHLDPGGRFVQGLLLRAADLEPRRLVAIGAGMLAYAAVLSTEGLGLLLRKRWAEYLTIVATGVFIPLEFYELARHRTFTRLEVLIVNVAIVWYLAARLRAQARAHEVTSDPRRPAA